MSDKLYPFERNRYYAGKMLTTADFKAEQSYHIGKQKFLNTLMYGAGVVCGMGVFNLDDLSVLIESGAAVDGDGNMIIVDSSVVKKLSAIDGYDRLRSNEAALCIKYEEKDVHSVYSVNRTEKDGEFEYNRVSEGYHLYLEDYNDLPGQIDVDSEFLTTGTLLETEDFKVDLVLPSFACKGSNYRILVKVSKLSNSNVRLNLHTRMQTPSFTTPTDEHEFDIDLTDIYLAKGEIYSKEYWVKAAMADGADTNILVKAGTAEAYVEDNAVSVNDSLSLKILLENTKPRTLINREIGRLSLEMKEMGAAPDFIVLAKLKLVKADSAYVIDEIIERDVKYYIPTPAKEELRAEYLDCFVKKAEILKDETGIGGNRFETEKTTRGEQRFSDSPIVATGTLEIPLGDNAKRGEVYYSGEKMHGLGPGNVFVSVGLEAVSDDESLGANAKNTIYGNADLFDNGKKAAIKAETAVKVLNDKGSFLVAAKLEDNVDVLILTYRWVAIKFPAGEDMSLSEKYKGKSIVADNPTVVLGPKESHFFGVKYQNLENVSISYELTEERSGEITPDGVYTAPSKEGVYEIKIYCTDMPYICTYAYAIVKKKDVEE